MNRRFSFVLFCLLLPLAFSACSRNGIYGSWQNADRYLRFTSYGDFEIEYKSPGLVKALRGEAVRKGELLVLLFEEYVTLDGTVHSVTGTDLENHTEVLRFSFNKDRLITEILSSGERYSYSKCE